MRTDGTDAHELEDLELRLVDPAKNRFRLYGLVDWHEG